MLYRAIDLAKREGKKVPVNFQVYPELKDKFENLCKQNKVTVTGLLTALMESAIEESQGIYFNIDVKSFMNINQRILEIEKELSSAYHWEGDDYVLNYEYENNHKFIQRLESLRNEKLRLEQIITINQNGGVNDESIIELKNTIQNMNKLINDNVDESDVGFNPLVVKKAAERKLNILAGINPDEE